MRLRLSPMILALSLVTSAAFAQSDADKATARQLAVEGQDALDKKDFKTAEDRFRRADQLFHAPTLALGLARAYAANGKFVEAQETYNRIIREGVPAGAPAAFQNAVDSAKTEVQTVVGKIGSVLIVVTGAENPKVTLDDQPFPTAALGVKRAANPGLHVVRASADGYKPAETKVTVVEGGSANAALTLEKDPNAVVAVAPTPTPGQASANPSPTPPPQEPSGGGSSTKTIGIVLMGVGGVGLAAGAVTGILAMGKHSDLEKACPGGKCASDKQSDVDSYNSLGLISTIGFVAGGVLAAGGAVLFFTAPKERTALGPSSRALVAVPKNNDARALGQSGAFITPVIGPLSVGAAGRF